MMDESAIIISCYCRLVIQCRPKNQAQPLESGLHVIQKRHGLDGAYRFSTDAALSLAREFRA